MGVDDLGTWRSADEMRLEESIEAKPHFQLGFQIPFHRKLMQSVFLGGRGIN